MVEHYTRDWLIIRLGGILGPGLKKNPVYDLVHDLPLRVDPGSEYQYLSTDFFAQAVFKLAEKGLWRETFNICGTGTVGLREISSWLKKPLGCGGEGKPREKYLVNNEKINRSFGLPESRLVVREYLSLESEK
jgi:nucleoside-diphosphate-sugar epimerase